jgi:hypothetical protein
MGMMVGLGFGVSPNALAQSGTGDIEPQLVEGSPTLRKWLEKVPDVRSDIQNDPAFRSRLRVGYVNFGESDPETGFQVGVEDLRVAKSRFTFSAGYRSNGDGNTRNFGADLHYQLRPLGMRVNVAPMVGFRRVTVDDQATTGLNLGWRTRLNLSRGGGADITIDQSWVAPGSNQEAGLTKLAFGYAIQKNWRLVTDWQRQNTKRSHETQLGLAIEYLW